MNLLEPDEDHCDPKTGYLCRDCRICDKAADAFRTIIVTRELTIAQALKAFRFLLQDLAEDEGKERVALNLLSIAVDVLKETPCDE